MDAAKLLTRFHVLLPLEDRRFAFLWIGQTVSVLGDRVYQTALPFVVLQLHGNVTQLSRTLLLFAVCKALALLVGGVTVDRASRRTTLLISDVTRGLAVTLMAVMLFTNTLHIAHIYAISAFFGFVSAFFQPAITGIVPELVVPEHLIAAGSLRSMSNEVSGVVGPLVGGVLVATGGVAIAVGLDAVSFIVSAFCVLAIPVTARRGATADTVTARGLRSYWRDVTEGVRVMAATQWLWLGTLLSTIGTIFFAGALSVALPLLAAARFGGAAGYGWVLSGMALSSVLAALLLGSRKHLRYRGLLIYALIAASGGGMLLLATCRTALQATLVAAVFGGCITGFLIVRESTVQQLVPPASLGRVLSLDYLGSLILLPLGYPLYGALIEATGPATAIAFSGTGLVALALVGISFRSIRDLQ